MSGIDYFRHLDDEPSGPGRMAFAITPDNDDALPVVPKRLYVGTGGNVTLRAVGSNADVVYKNVGDGVYLNVRPEFVRATGTTAADIVGEG